MGWDSGGVVESYKERISMYTMPSGWKYTVKKSLTMSKYMREYTYNTTQNTQQQMQSNIYEKV